MDKLQAWIKQNTILAAVIGFAGVFAIVLIIVIISLFKSGGPTKAQVDAASSEPNVCKRLLILQHLETKQKGFSPEYLGALKKAYSDLTKQEPTADDTLALAGLISDCPGLDNTDFGWLVIVETRFRKGEWPSFPQEPPTNANVRGRLHEALVQYSRLPVQIANDAALRERWLRFAVENPEYQKNPQAPVGPLLAIFYNPDDTQANHLALYQQLAQMAGTSGWLARKIYDRIGLLPEPLFVVDTQPETAPEGLQRGADDTLRFLGVVEGERCAIAIDGSPLPPLWIRSCKGLKPRRLAAGELFMLATEAKGDPEDPLHWMPVLVEEAGDARFGEALRGKIDDRVLAAFMTAAPRFVLGPKGLVPFAPAPSVAVAYQGEGGPTFASFKSGAMGSARPRVLAFSPQAKIKLDKSCPKVDKARCDAIKGSGDADHCELAAPMCFTLGGQAMLRATPVRVVRPLPCIKEYGEKPNCKASELTGLFVDPIAEGSNDYTQGPFYLLHEKKAVSDD